MNQSRGKRKYGNPAISENLKGCLCGILHKYAAPEQPLNIKQIAEYLKKETSGRSEDPINISMPTMRKALNELHQFSSENPAFFCLIYGGYIRKYILDPAAPKRRPAYLIVEDTGISDMDSASGKASNQKAFYAFESQFQPQELFSLLNCAEVNPYLSEKEIYALRRRLANAATPELVRQSCISYKPGVDKKLHTNADSEHLLTNLARLIELLHSECQIEVNYGKYIFEPIESGLVLTPTRTTAEGLPKWQRLDPIAIFEANGFYYLAAHTDKSDTVDDLATYRIDRMLAIRPYTDFSRKPLPLAQDILRYRETFSALEYKKTHPVMYGGDRVDIRMLVCEDASFFLGNVLLDTFGPDCSIRPISEQEAQTYLSASTKTLAEQGERWYMVHLNHTIPGTVLWAKQHVEHVRLLSPQAAVDALIESVTTGLSRYRHP